MASKRSAAPATPDQGSGQPPTKKKKNGATAATRRGETYAWMSCASEQDDLKRVEIKEQARREADLHAEKIEKILLPLLKSHSSDTEENPAQLGVDEVKDWVAQLAEVRKKHDEFRVYIGVAGATGAGKTSALNAVLGFRDLLPCSCEGAATAAVCQVSYNNDNDPKKAFRAEVIFRSEANFRSDLDLCLEDLRLKARLEEELNRHKDDSDGGVSAEKQIAAYNDLQVVDNNIDEVLSKILTIWDLDQEDLINESTESLLAKNNDVLALLGRTISITDAESDSFADKIKPYLDSASADHGDTGLQFPAWPLIDEVRIYLKSDVLKNGIVLVDLPGLADNVESRAAVAQRYFSQLTLTAIVTPIIRARNEQTGVQLMTDHQELMMQMDGKFHKKAFCVVLSKMDEIDVKAHLKRHAEEARADQSLEDSRDKLRLLRSKYVEDDRRLKEALQNQKSLKKKYDAARKAQCQATKRRDDEGTKEAIEKVREINALGRSEGKLIHSLSKVQDSNAKLARHLEGHIHHWCVRGRNGRVQAEIQQDFQRRQKRLVGKEQQDLYDGNVKIFPISSKTYWRVEEETEKPVGFPSLRYTGILAFRSWLRYATVAERERHLDMTLNAFHGLFNGMDTWSTNEWKEPLVLTKDFIQSQVLDASLKKLKFYLKPVFNQLHKDIKALNPMKSKNVMTQVSKEGCKKVVRGWAMKKPDDPRSKDRIHWATYNACIVRQGATYRSGRPTRIRYAWIEKLSNLFYDGVVQEWNTAVNQNIPDLKIPTCEKIDVLWDKFLKELGKRVESTAPEMLAFLASVLPSLQTIKEEIKDRAGQTITEVSIGASRAHRCVLKSIQGKWEVAFKKAMKEHGQGRFIRQREILESHAARRGANMFESSSDDVEKKLAQNLKRVRADFDAVITFALERVQGHIALLLDNAVRANDDGGGSAEVGMILSRKQKAQRGTRRVIAEWAAHWRIGDYHEAEAWQREMAIPEVYDDGYGQDAESDDDELADIDFDGKDDGAD